MTAAVRTETPEVEQEIVRDMIKRAAPAIPVLAVVGGLVWGADGVASVTFSVGLVLINFLVAATLLTWAGRISVGLLMGVALFGYVFRLALLTAAVFLVKDTQWFSAVPFSIALLATHLGLLLWEMRFVSASMAFPGLKPKGIS